MGAVQILVIVLLVLQVLVGIYSHGKIERVHFLRNLINALSLAMLLSAGGFWEK